MKHPFIFMKNNKETETKMTFQEVDGIWRRVDSQEPYPLTLAEALNVLNILIDDNTEFCRIKRYLVNTKEEIIYRAYSGKITITVWESSIQ